MSMNISKLPNLGSVLNKPDVKQAIHLAGIDNVLTYQYKNQYLVDTVEEELGSVEAAKTLSELDVENKPLNELMGNSVEIIKGNENLKTAHNAFHTVTEGVANRYLTGARKAMKEVLKNAGNYHEKALADIIWDKPKTKKNIHSAGIDKLQHYQTQNPFLSGELPEKEGIKEVTKKLKDLEFEGKGLSEIARESVKIIQENENLKAAEDNSLISITDKTVFNYLGGVRRAMSESLRKSPNYNEQIAVEVLTCVEDQQNSPTGWWQSIKSKVHEKIVDLRYKVDSALFSSGTTKLDETFKRLDEKFKHLDEYNKKMNEYNRQMDRTHE